MTTISRRTLVSALLAAPMAARAQDGLQLPQGNVGPVKQDPEVQPLRGTRYGFPIRIGGVFTLGLGEDRDLMEDSGRNKTPLSETNARWLAAHCDVAALPTVNLKQDTFPAITKAQPLFTPLLYFYASTLHERDDVKGNVGGWQPGMAAWTLKAADGQEAAHPDRGGHWMGFDNRAWGEHWRERVAEAVGKYGAQGAVAAELPLGNTFVGEELAQELARPESRAGVTEAWLKAAHAPGRFYLIPSALGFDALAGRVTQPTPPGTEQPHLPGRLWDHYYPYVDGGWAEGWVRPYWADGPLPENIWELHIEAADRAARGGQVFIAAAAYRNDSELEFVLASYLLAAHRQGRFVLQPMPLLPATRQDAGHSLALLKKVVAAKAHLFNAPLGAAIQERHLIQMEGGMVWRRAFNNGAAYVNSTQDTEITLALGGLMERTDGTPVRSIKLGPQQGAILLYPKSAQK